MFGNGTQIVTLARQTFSQPAISLVSVRISRYLESLGSMGASINQQITFWRIQPVERHKIHSQDEFQTVLSVGHHESKADKVGSEWIGHGWYDLDSAIGTERTMEILPCLNVWISLESEAC